MLALLTLGGLVIAGLSGCSGQAGAAAVVNGKPISVAELQAATTDLSPYLQNVTQSSVLMVLVVAPIFDRAAAKAGVGVSKQLAVDLLAQVATAGAKAKTGPVRTGAFSDAAVEVARFTLVQTNLKALPDAAAVSADVAKQLGALDATINPRYGTADFTTGAITAPSYPWLVRAPAAG